MLMLMMKMIVFWTFGCFFVSLECLEDSWGAVVSVHISEKFWSLQSLSLCQYFWLDFSNEFWRVRRNEATLANKQIWYGKNCTRLHTIPSSLVPMSRVFLHLTLLLYCHYCALLRREQRWWFPTLSHGRFQDSRIPGSSVSWWSIARSFKLFARFSDPQVLCNKINLEVGCSRGGTVEEQQHCSTSLLFTL